MGNILKTWLKKNHLTGDYTPQVAVQGNMVVADIVDEMLKDGLDLKRETVIDIINCYNRKSADLTLSGYTVNNGLVNMRSFIRGSLIDGKWNPNANWVDVSLSHGKDLYQALTETTVDVLGEKEESLESYNLSGKTSQSTENFQNNARDLETDGSQHKTEREPACGMAFRRWLCKA